MRRTSRTIESRHGRGQARPRGMRRLARHLTLHILLFGLVGIACDGRRPALEEVGLEAIDADGLSTLRRFAIDRVLDYRVFRRARAGYVALVARKGRVVHARTTGWADLEARVPMKLDTRFHIASMTKPITAVAAMLLVEEGRLDLDERLDAILPDFANAKVVDRRTEDGGLTARPAKNPIRIRHLLTFRSGIGGYAETDDPLDRRWRSPDIEEAGLGSLADRVARIRSLPLYEEPGQRWRYGWSLDVLARVIEVVSGEPYARFLNRRIFEPLGMDATGYADAVPVDAPWAQMYTHNANGDLIRERRFDEYYGRGWASGGGGLVSTAPDYLRFALMLAEGGELEGVRLLRPETVKEMTRLHVPEGVLTDEEIGGLGWGLGVSVMADADASLLPGRDGDYWWSGRFGTHFWVSPRAETVVVVMQQTERGPHSDLPIAPALVQFLAMPR